MAIETLNRILSSLDKSLAWLDADKAGDDPRCRPGTAKRVEIDRCLPFVFLHLGAAMVLVTGWSLFSLAVCGSLYLLRMFAVTAFYHRYFSHRSFKTSRFMQFCFAVLGASAVQKGPLWWAAHHRQHHKSSDHDGDPHSPVLRGFLWSHIGWITSSQNMPTDYSLVPDFASYPELRWLNRFDWFVPAMLALVLYLAGEALNQAHPELGCNGTQLLVWGFFVSTVLLFHATCFTNSLNHMLGTRRYATSDSSRNNFFLAMLTMGEGWHNNHHRFSSSARQGFMWWELDLSYYLLVLLSKLGLVWDLKPVPAAVLAEKPGHASALSVDKLRGARDA